MKRHTLLSLLTAAAILPTTALAQVTYDSNVGTGSGALGDDAIHTVGPLGFTFTFPDGSTTATSLDIDTNGRILPPGGDSSDFGESVSELLSQTTSLCPYWDDLTPTGIGGVGEIFFSTTATQANITFQDVKLFGGAGTTNFTFQVQLFADGRIGYLYDARTPADEPLVGLSEGAGAADPGGSDLSAAPSTSGVTTLYQDFPSSGFDLTDLAIEFTPDGSGGWTTIVGASGFPAPPIPGTAAIVGKPIVRTIDFYPDGSGGYIVTRGAPSWFDDSAIGTDIGTGLGDDGLAGPLALGYAFTMPDGSAVTEIFVDNNGRVLADDSDSGDFNPSLPEFLGTGGFTPAPASICAFWTDLSAQLGSLTFFTDPIAGKSSITWRDVPQFGEDDVAEHTFQIVLRRNGSFSLSYEDTSEWRTGSGFTSDDVLIGCSSGTGGAGSDPGASNFSELVNFSNGEGTVYEFWDASTGVDGNPDVQPILYVTGVPELGGTVDYFAEGLPSSAFLPTLLVGFSNPGDIPLDILGVEGGVLSTSAEISVPLVQIGNTASFSTPLDNVPALVGVLNIFTQVAYFEASETSLGVSLTNGSHVSF